MRIPNRPNPDDQSHEALLDKAYSVHAGKPTAHQEQREDQLIHTIDSSLDAAKAAVAELKNGQEKEETDPTGQQETGSPTAQGFP